MVTFNELWQLLYDHGSSNYYKHDCCEVWESLTPAELIEQERKKGNPVPMYFIRPLLGWVGD